MKKACGVLLFVGLCSNLKLRFTAAGNYDYYHFKKNDP